MDSNPRAPLKKKQTKPTRDHTCAVKKKRPPGGSVGLSRRHANVKCASPGKTSTAQTHLSLLSSGSRLAGLAFQAPQVPASHLSCVLSWQHLLSGGKVCKPHQGYTLTLISKHILIIPHSPEQGGGPRRGLRDGTGNVREPDFVKVQRGTD